MEVSGSGPVTTVFARGELDLITVPRLRDVLAAQHGPVVLDLRGLSFIDVSGLHLLYDADARARRRAALALRRFAVFPLPERGI